MPSPDRTLTTSPCVSPLSPRAAVLSVVAVIVLPACGWIAAGKTFGGILRFPPPLEIPSEYPRWSWFAAALAAGAIAWVFLSWARARREVRTRSPANRPAETCQRPLPWWAWCALGWIAFWWVVAWTRHEAFQAIQRFTFFPLWLGFIAVVNGLAWRRTGRCLMVDSPRRWLKLFAVSAAFWWVFEWLNRFVRNWHYLGVGDFGALAYAVNATVCFSTVLPAVAAVSEWLATFARLQVQWSNGPRWRGCETRGAGGALIALGTLALFFTGMAPRIFYPALWGAPLALGFGVGVLSGRRGLWTELAAGDWRRTANWALAACVCGGFWEMWNWRSAAKWIYTVPYVDRWHVFEMPALGYAGYLAFGLECWLVVAQLGAGETRSVPRRDPRMHT